MLRHRVEGVRDGARRAAQPHRDALRLDQRLGSQLLHFHREGGREQHGLPPCRHRLDDALHVRQEAHVEHTVALVQHQDLDAVQFGVALGHQVQQAARAGHQDIHALLEGLDLRRRAHAAVDGDAAQLGPRGEHADDLVDLLGQLARRRDDEGARQAVRRPGRGIQQLVEDGQHEGGGLAGAGLCRADDIPAAQGGGQGGFLDGSGGFIARALDPGLQAGVQIELLELHDFT